MPKKRKEAPGNSVPVVLEKATEFPKNTPVLQVAPELLKSIKSESQIIADQEKMLHEESELAMKAYYKNKALYYSGIFASVAVLWLAFRYFKRPKIPVSVMGDILNGSVDIVPK